MATKNIVLTQTVYEMGAKQMHYWWEHSSMKMSRIIFNGGDGGQILESISTLKQRKKSFYGRCNKNNTHVFRYFRGLVSDVEI